LIGSDRDLQVLHNCFLWPTSMLNESAYPAESRDFRQNVEYGR